MGALPQLAPVIGRRSVIRSMLLSLSVLLAGCNTTTFGYSSWIEAPLMADGVADASTGSYSGFDKTLRIHASSTAWLHFSLATLPSGKLWTVSPGSSNSTMEQKAYPLTADKVVSARLVLLVQSVKQGGHLSITMADDATAGCFVNERLGPNCGVMIPSTPRAMDADRPSSPLAITRTGFYSLDVTDLVRRGVGRPSLAFALQPSAGEPAGDFTIGSKEQDIGVVLNQGGPSIATSFAPSARLYVTLSDAVGQVSTTDIYSTIPNVRNFRRSASDPTVADTRFLNQDMALLQGPPGAAQQDQAYLYVATPTFLGGSNQFRTAVDKAFPDGVSVRQTLAVSAMAPAAEPAPAIRWYSVPGSNALTWSAWQPPGSAAELAPGPLLPSVQHQTALLDLSQPTAMHLKETYDRSDQNALSFAVAATSNSAASMELRMDGGVQPRYITAITPRPQAGAGALYDRDDSTFEQIWCAKIGQGSNACTPGIDSLSVSARVGKPFPLMRLVPLLDTGDKALGMVFNRSELHLSLPEEGASAVDFAPYLPQFLFKSGANGGDAIGYGIPLGRANRTPGKYDGIVSLPGHNQRFIVHYENLPLPTPSLSGPVDLTLPWPQGTPSVVTSPFHLDVDDTLANLNDDTLQWKITSSHPGDTVPAQALQQATGGQSFNVTFQGAGRRTLTATSVGDAAATASLDVMVQAATATLLSSSTTAAVVGQPVTLTANVQGALAVMPGMVQWLDGVQPLGTTPLSASGQAQRTFSLARGVHNLTAVYSGDSTSGMLGSASATVQVSVQQAGSSTSLQLPSAISIGTPFAAQVRVSALAPSIGVPGGTVEIRGAGDACTAPLSNGQGECSLRPTAAGSQSFTATYPGDADFSASSDTRAQSASRLASQTRLTVPSSLKPGQSAQFSVRVTAVQNSDQVPSGTVTIASAQSNCTVTLDAGAGSCSMAPATVSGTLAITAHYAGDTHFDASSAQQNLDVNAVASVMEVTSRPNPSRPGEKVTFQVTVSPDPAKASLGKDAPTAPRGTVVLTDGGAELGRIELDAHGAGSLTIDNLSTPGEHTITATYSGDAQNAAVVQTYVQTVAEPVFTPVPTITSWALWVLSFGMSLGVLVRNRRHTRGWTRSGR